MKSADHSPRSGASLKLRRGSTLVVIDPEGEQVSDLVAYNAADAEEYISSGRSIDYASTHLPHDGRYSLFQSVQTTMLTIVHDERWPA